MIGLGSDLTIFGTILPFAGVALLFTAAVVQFVFLAKQSRLVKDLTEVRSLGAPGSERALDDLAKRLRQLQSMVSRSDQNGLGPAPLMPKMNHELRNELSGIVGFAEMIEQQALGPIGNDRYHDYAVDIRKSGQRLLAMLNALLDLANIESGKAAIREELIAAETLLTGIVNGVKASAQEYGVELTLDCAESLPTLRADRQRLAQILTVLLSNGVNFTPRGGRVTLRCWARGDSGCVFQVIDNGVGMAREDIPLALSGAGGIENALADRSYGAGLGLPLAKALAELHGGTLDLQSEEGKGTTATLRLPAHRMVKQPAAAIEAVAS